MKRDYRKVPEEADKRLELELCEIIRENEKRYNTAIQTRLTEANREQVYEEIHEALLNLDEAYEKVDINSLYHDKEKFVSRWKKVKRLLEIYDRTVRKDNEEPDGKEERR